MFKKIFFPIAILAISLFLNGADYGVAALNDYGCKTIIAFEFEGTCRAALLEKGEPSDSLSLEKRFKKKFEPLKDVLKRFFGSAGNSVVRIYLFDETISEALGRELADLSKDPTSSFKAERVKIVYDFKVPENKKDYFQSLFPKDITIERLRVPVYREIRDKAFFKGIAGADKVAAVEVRIEKAVYGDWGDYKEVICPDKKIVGQGLLKELRFKEKSFAQVRVYFIEYAGFLCFLYASDNKNSQAGDIPLAAKKIEAMLVKIKELSGEDPVDKLIFKK